MCPDGMDEIFVEVFGYCHASTAQIAALIRSRREREVVQVGGNFVVVAKQGQKIWIITSPYGVVAYFYSVRPTCFSHGPTVLDVLRRSGIEWQWNVEGLADLFALEHLTGCMTLHAGVDRTPAASVLHWDGEALHRWSATWSEIHDRRREHGSSDRMVDLLCEEVSRCVGSSPAVLSASGGFDSRVLLATLLVGGWKPELVVQGYSNSTDRIVVEAIGRRFGLKVHGIELTTEDYLSAADKICRATNGTKPAAHWHSYIYPAKSGLTENSRFFVGANGEFVRTYFLDKGIISLAADRLSPSLVLREFWKRKMKSVLKTEELAGVRSDVAEYLRDGANQQATRLANARPQGSTLHQLDQFYLEERVRHFIGNGLALYGLSVAWRTPFLSVPWVAQAEKLPRPWKLGNNWHRHAIARLLPELLDYPEEHVGPSMAKRHAALYWLPSRRRRQVVPYVDYNKIFADERILSLLLHHARDVDDLIDGRIIEKIIEEHRSSGGRQRAISILLGIAVWRRSARVASALQSSQPGRVRPAEC